MNRDDIIRMAEEANGEPAWCGGVDWTWDEVERFAKLVAAAEREACAKVCDVLADKHTFEGGYANECAFAIRERGAP